MLHPPGPSEFEPQTCFARAPLRRRRGRLPARGPDADRRRRRSRRRGDAAGGEAAAGSEAPNIVMIMTDDQAKSTMSPEVMPNLYTKLMAAGTTLLRLHRHDAALLPLAGRLHDRPVRPQQRHPAQLLPRPAGEEERAPDLAAAAGLLDRPRRQVPERLRGGRARPGRRRPGVGSLVHAARAPQVLRLEGLQERRGRPLRDRRQGPGDDRDQQVRRQLDRAPGQEEGPVLPAGRLLRAAHGARPRHALPGRPRAGGPRTRASTTAIRSRTRRASTRPTSRRCRPSSATSRC